MLRAALALVAVVVALTAAGCRDPERQDGGDAQPSAGPVAGTVEDTLTVDGARRTYRVHVPPSVAGRTGLPLVIGLHGGGGNGAQFEQQSRLSIVADRSGFVVVYPDGNGRTRLLTWNAGNCCAYARDNHIDDVKFIAAMLDALIAKYHIDPA